MVNLMSDKKGHNFTAALHPAVAAKYRSMAGLPPNATQADGDLVTLVSAVIESNKELHEDFIEGMQVSNQRVNELQARLQSAEQLLVAGPGGGYVGYPTDMGTNNLAATLTQEVESNHQFSALRQWTPGAACRLEARQGIHAALTNSGSGGEGTTAIPRQPEQSGYYGEPQAPLNLIQVLPVRTTDRDSVEFIQITSTGEASEQLKEGDEKEEIDFSGTKRTVEIVTVAAHTTASKQVLNDHAALTSEVDRVIRYKLMSRLENQLINGDGTPGRITGLLANAIIFTPAYAPTISDNAADKIGEALTTMKQQGLNPNLVLMNPMDWFMIQVMKTETEKNYIFGSPTVPIPPSIWNTIVVVSHSMPINRALCIDTSHVTLLDRETPSVVMSNSHKDYFTRNLVAILGELRAGLEVRDLRAVRLVFVNQTSSSE